MVPLIKTPIFRFLFIPACFFLWLVAASGCRKVEEPGLGSNQGPTSFLLTQSELDEATLVFRSQDNFITGAPFGHRENDSTRFLIREIYSNVPAGQSLKTGSVISIRAFRKENGRKGRLHLIDLMVKQDPGYNREGGDFEYIRIMFDPGTDYAAHPNGLLPDLLNGRARGVDLDVAPESCVTCHHKAGRQQFVFSRTFP